MAGFRLEMHIPGFNQLRRETAVQEALHQVGQRIADAAGGSPDFIVVDSPNKTRSRVIVVTATPAGMEAEAKDRVLTRALDAGR